MTPQPQDDDEFRITRWQLAQIVKYADLERIAWACLLKPSCPAPSPEQCNAESFRAIIEQNRAEAAAQAREKVLTEITEHLQSKRGEVMRMATDAYPIGVLDGTVLYLESLRTGVEAP